MATQVEFVPNQHATEAVTAHVISLERLGRHKAGLGLPTFDATVADLLENT